MIAVRGRRRRVDEARNAGIPRRDQHVEEAGAVRLVRGERIGNRPRHRAERRFVQDDVHAFAGLTAGDQVGNVRFDEAVPLPRRVQPAPAAERSIKQSAKSALPAAKTRSARIT